MKKRLCKHKLYDEMCKKQSSKIWLMKFAHLWVSTEYFVYLESLCITSNTHLWTRSAPPRRNAIFGLLTNYLFTQFQKVKWAHSRCIFLSNSSRRLSLASWPKVYGTCMIFMSKDLRIATSSAFFTRLSGTHIDATCEVHEKCLEHHQRVLIHRRYYQ